MTEALFIVLTICVTAVIVAAFVARAKSEANRSSERAAMYEAMQAQSRAQADAETQARAMQLYALQSVMDTIKGQAQAAAYTQTQTAAALSKAIDGIEADQKTIAKLEELHTRAIVDTYTRLCLTDKGEYKRGGSRYWEEVDYYV